MVEAGEEDEEIDLLAPAQEANQRKTMRAVLLNLPVLPRVQRR
jgi:hypothetical protein